MIFAHHPQKLDDGVAIDRDGVDRVLGAERRPDQRSERDHDVGLGDQLAQEARVARIALDRRKAVKPAAIGHGGVTLGKPIEQRDVVARLQQQRHHDAPDIAGASGD